MIRRCIASSYARPRCLQVGRVVRNHKRRSGVGILAHKTGGDCPAIAQSAESVGWVLAPTFRASSTPRRDKEGAVQFRALEVGARTPPYRYNIVSAISTAIASTTATAN